MTAAMALPNVHLHVHLRSACGFPSGTGCHRHF
jgi:hypothetical protein